MTNKERDAEEAKKQNNPTDFGWANGWKEEPDIVKKCRELKHETTDIDVGPPHRGYEHVIRCVKCNYVYRVDSSD